MQKCNALAVIRAAGFNASVFQDVATVEIARATRASVDIIEAFLTINPLGRRFACDVVATYKAIRQTRVGKSVATSLARAIKATTAKWQVGRIDKPTAKTGGIPPTLTLLEGYLALSKCYVG